LALFTRFQCLYLATTSFPASLPRLDVRSSV